MALADYRRKRHFDKTPEPAGKVTKRRPHPLSFVVQKHDARRLHYDFRLELDGVLVSWAVPKGPSLDPREKRLAVHVEDHPLDYANFEGRIPAGEYGAGDVIIWDRGTWTPDGDPHTAIQRGKLEFELKGEKLRGGWRLLRLKGGSRGEKDNWLLMKRNDAAARTDDEFSVTEGLPESVKSGRLLDGEDPEPAQVKSNKRHSSEFRFALATLVNEPPDGKEWLHEIKFDGYRLLVVIERKPRSQKSVRLLTRNQLDWTSRYREVAAAATKLAVKSAVIDGELVALDEAGVSRFQLLQNAGQQSARLVYYAFDLLEHDGQDLRSLPLVERKDRLREVLSDKESLIQYSDHYQGHGSELLAECCRRGLEGIVSKRAKRPYEAGRTRDWLKVKCLGREELVIGAFTDSHAAGREFGALLLGYFRGGDFVYAGRVGTGFDAVSMNALHRQLSRLEQPTSPFASTPSRERVRGIHWVRPQLVAQIEFGSWTDGGVLRHASFQGLRADKPATRVGPPESLPNPPGAQEENMRRQKTKSTRAAGKDQVQLTHPDRVLYPELGLTKQQLADYYAVVAGLLLPHVASRPLAMLRCPEGIGGKCFFQKHAAAGTPEVLRRVPIAEKVETEEYLVVDDAAGLQALAQMSVLELHPWGSQAGREDSPDRLIFDLDPGPKVTWQDVVEAAVQLRELLEQLELKSFVKTSGGKGVHVVAPLGGRLTWPVLKHFARSIAEHFAQQHPDRFTAKMAKNARQGRIFIDYLRNDRGSTAVAPYSPRARQGAPVSMPLAWEELPDVQNAGQFTVPSILNGKVPRDPWRGFHRLKQDLPEFALQKS